MIVTWHAGVTQREHAPWPCMLPDVSKRLVERRVVALSVYSSTVNVTALPVPTIQNTSLPGQ